MARHKPQQGFEVGNRLMVEESNSNMWDCHADLQAEWEMFSNECSMKNQNDSTLFMKFWSQKDALDPCKSSQNNVKHPHQTEEMYVDESFNDPPVAVIRKDSDLAMEDEFVELNDVQLHKINSLALELSHLLETNCNQLPINVRGKISDLSRSGVAHMIIDLRSRLSEQGMYNLCLSLCDGSQLDPWIDISLVFIHLILPSLTGDSVEPIGAMLSSGVEKLARDFSSLCVKHLLHPLVSDEKTIIPHLKLVASIVPVLSIQDFIILLRKFVETCSTPMEDWQLAVLTTLMSEVSLEFRSAALDTVLSTLLPIMKISVVPFARSEQFARLLLAIIPAVSSGVKQDTRNELSVIAKQNKSFSKKKILDALKML